MEIKNYYEIKTVGDLIKELSKYDSKLPIKKLDISPSDIASLSIQDINAYKFGGEGEIEKTYKALVIR